MTSGLLQIYNNLMMAHGLTCYRGWGDQYDVAARFLVWCAGNGIDPERWIRARHEANGWRHRIKIEHLRNDKFLVKFKSWGDDRQAYEVKQDRDSTKSVIAERSEASREAARRGYARAGDLFGCFMTATVGDQFTGYSVESKTCLQCPHHEACR